MSAKNLHEIERASNTDHFLFRHRLRHRDVYYCAIFDMFLVPVAHFSGSFLFLHMGLCKNAGTVLVRLRRTTDKKETP